MEYAALILRCTINGDPQEIWARGSETLADILRGKLGLTGTKIGCDRGECGSCAVLVDGHPQLACLLLALECEGRAITTVEGLAEGGQLSALQQAFHSAGAAQCGFCTPGFLMTATALLDKNPNPTLDEVKGALSGNLCRCTGYMRIFDAVLAAAKGEGP